MAGPVAAEAFIRVLLESLLRGMMVRAFTPNLLLHESAAVTARVWLPQKRLLAIVELRCASFGNESPCR